MRCSTSIRWSGVTVKLRIVSVGGTGGMVEDGMGQELTTPMMDRAASSAER